MLRNHHQVCSRQNPVESPRAIAVVRTSALGDVVLTLPAIRALRQVLPAVPLVFISKAAYLPILQSQFGNSHGLLYPTWTKKWQFQQTLAGFSVDTLLDLHGKWQHQPLFWGYPFRQRAAIASRPFWPVLATRWLNRPYHVATWQSRYAHQAVERLVGRQIAPLPLQLVPTDNGLAAAAALLAAQQLPRNQPYIVLAPGAQWYTKRWPAAYFAAVAKYALNKSYAVVLTGTNDEKKLLTAVQHCVPKCTARIINLAGCCSIEVLIGVIAQAVAVVANDSGPMHISRALGTSTIALFGSTAANQFDFTGHQLLDAQLKCAPCSLYGRARCPRGDLACMHAIKVETVCAALEQSLKIGRAPYTYG